MDSTILVSNFVRVLVIPRFCAKTVKPIIEILSLLPIAPSTSLRIASSRSPTNGNRFGSIFDYKNKIILYAAYTTTLHCTTQLFMVIIAETMGYSIWQIFVREDFPVSRCSMFLPTPNDSSIIIYIHCIKAD